MKPVRARLLAQWAVCLIALSVAGSSNWLNARLNPGFATNSVSATGAQLLSNLNSILLFSVASLVTCWFLPSVARRIVAGLSAALFATQLITFASFVNAPLNLLTQTNLVTKVTGIGNADSQLTEIAAYSVQPFAWIAPLALVLGILATLQIVFSRKLWSSAKKDYEIKKAPSEESDHPADLWNSQQ